MDIINQTDAVESIDGEQKLGQPMLQYTRIHDWGVIDAFVLPVFRERTFAGEDARLTGGLVVKSHDALYQSDREHKHVDLALRYSHTIDIVDFGSSWFQGTNREAQLLYSGSPNAFQPYYRQIQQVGLDMQVTIDDWLWKLEAIVREQHGNDPREIQQWVLATHGLPTDDFAALTAGFEYTWVGILETGIDLGLLSEFSRDNSRGDNTPHGAQKDLFLGTRLTFNDTQSTEFLLGYSQDLDNRDSYIGFIEASRRLGAS